MNHPSKKGGGFGVGTGTTNLLEMRLQCEWHFCDLLVIYAERWIPSQSGFGSV